MEEEVASVVEAVVGEGTEEEPASAATVIIILEAVVVGG